MWTKLKGRNLSVIGYARVGIEEQRLDLKRDAGGQETRFRKDGLPGKRSEHFAIVVENDWDPFEALRGEML